MLLSHRHAVESNQSRASAAQRVFQVESARGPTLASLRRLCIYHALHLGSNSSCAVIIVIMQSCSQNAPD